MSILIKDIPLGGYEISIMKDGERYRARVDGIWCEVDEIPTTEPDTDTISRQAAINVVKGIDRSFVKYIEELPPAQLGTNLAEVGTDCISRQAAIDALRMCYDTETITMDNGDEYIDYGDAVNEIEQLPPAQPEPHWIPVTEATPTEDDDYLATFEAETGRFVDWASWYQGRWVVWIEGSPAPLSNVIAWCKPMEPYKGATT